jgi:uncharacterized protein YccT (UPF0319 family)
MKPLVCFILSGLFFISSISFSAVSIEVAEGISLLAVNGKTASEEADYSQHSVKIADGINQILVDFSAEIEESTNDSYIERTPAYVITFESTAERLLLNAPNISDRYDLSAFKADPHWALTTENGKTKDITVAELVKEGFQFNRDYEQELTSFNMISSPAAIIPGNKGSVAEENVVALEMLKYWYTKSSTESKTAFIRWLDE